jgi:hypothetical protein
MRLLRPVLALPVALGLVLAACGYESPLPRAIYKNVVDTVTLYALTGTPVRTPSGYNVQFREPMFIQDGGAFDFAIDLDSASRPLVLPTGALKMGRSSGAQISSLPFDSIRIAPTAGFQLDSATRVNVGERAIVHSRGTLCSYQIPAVFYAKLEILSVDTLARRVTFKILVDTNCGYRGLEETIPSL